MKSYTDLEQSKKLAEILPIESADMRIGNYVGESGNVDETNVHYYPKGESFGAPEIINAWSLAALLSILHYPSLHKTYTGWRCDSYNKKTNSYKFGEYADNPIDACVKMIIELYELKIL